MVGLGTGCGVTRINVRKPKGVTAHARQTKAARRLREYRLACETVDHRDDDACRNCGFGSERLHHHHLRPRSLGRDDTESNLLLLCADCHRDVHDKRLVIVGDDANGSLTFQRKCLRPEPA